MQSVAAFFARLRSIWPFFREAKIFWLLALASTIVAALTEPLIPALLQPLLDKGFNQGSFNLWLVPAALLGLFGLRGLAGFVAQYALAKFTNAGLLRMRQAMFSKLLTAELPLFGVQSSSALTNTLVYEVQTGSAMLTNAAMSLIKDSFTLAALVGYLLILNWRLTLVVALLFPAVALVMRTLSARLYKLTKASQLATDQLAYVVEENVLAHRDIRLHAAQADQLQRFSALSHALRNLSIKSSVASAAMTPMTQMLAAMALSAVIAMALVQSTGNQNSVGAFAAFVTAMLMLIAPIKHLSEVASPITRGLAAIERGLTLIETTPSECEGRFDMPRCQGHIIFDQVSVQFGDDAAPAVRNISLDVNPGETVALVGASGAGKTTLVNLLPRFLEPSSGTISLDGHPLALWQLDSLRRQFALVSQHVVMLSGSIAFNIALGQEIDRNRVMSCLKAAHLQTFVQDLPQGIDTQVGHNAMQLSGGQRQRLAIARALYKDAPVLILDEATSALDSESERAVQSALDNLMQNRTTLVIAHRLSTVQRANRIVVMDVGQIVEIGSHTQLMQQNGHYARLYQMGLHSEPTQADA
ncbi:MAG: lipid A export permease/ATP-binding protein MsbA [Rhodoferax sp.]|jgi:subfamily B ATP-binding cassette protein MsbA|uniref:lipid A export permease/ATP-binding protein MsbA n=1 Tax=Rhodoferax sp. TaxID=50421 RepID=UPI001B63EBF2|nr:lipid A export permease/ATP-binding protein MsbA [Rhodoferax sp.]MBP8286104.1 lipid A export permease/ATP-binding protein MsbA [Rhodoferax sp.]MBP9737079.1 lipid A export permease/ATP-binding protein MsbA [Rhodoferax sp.]